MQLIFLLGGNSGTNNIYQYVVKIGFLIAENSIQNIIYFIPADANS